MKRWMSRGSSLALVALVSVTACGGKVITSSGGTGGATASGGTSGASGSGGAGAVGGTGNFGATGGFGTGGSGTGGSGTGGSSTGGSSTGGFGTGGSGGGCTALVPAGTTCQQVSFKTSTCDTCMLSNCCGEVDNCFSDAACNELLGCYSNLCKNGNTQSCVNQQCSACLSGSTLLNAVSGCQHNKCGNVCQ